MLLYGCYSLDLLKKYMHPTLKQGNPPVLLLHQTLEALRWKRASKRRPEKTETLLGQEEGTFV